MCNLIALVTFSQVLYLGAALLPNVVLRMIPWLAAQLILLPGIATIFSHYDPESAIIQYPGVVLLLDWLHL